MTDKKNSHEERTISEKLDEIIAQHDAYESEKLKGDEYWLALYMLKNAVPTLVRALRRACDGIAIWRGEKRALPKCHSGNPDCMSAMRLLTDIEKILEGK